MSLPSIRFTLSAAFVSVLLAACGGGGSKSVPPAPTNLQVNAGDGQVTLNWTGVPGVNYQAIYAPGASVSTDVYGAGVSPIHCWTTSNGITSPYIVPNACQNIILTNGMQYAFAMNGFYSGGPGGPGTPSVTVTPRQAGVSWTAGSPALGAGNMYGIAYGTPNGATTPVYLAVGDSGAIYSGTQLSNWATVASQAPAQSTVNIPSAVNFRSVGFALTGSPATARFVAVGGSTTPSAQIYYSQDAYAANWTAATWTTGTAQPSYNLNAVATNGSGFVAVGDGGTILYSTDGVNWSNTTFQNASGTAIAAPTNNFHGITYAANAGFWVVVGDNGSVWLSNDGATGSVWVQAPITTPAPTANLHAVIAQPYFNTITIVGDAGTVITGTATGTGSGIGAGGAWVWTPSTLVDGGGNPLTTVNLTQVAASTAHYIFLDSTNAARSSNYVANSPVTPSATTGTYTSAQYVAVGSDGSVWASSYNPTLSTATWTPWTSIAGSSTAGSSGTPLLGMANLLGYYVGVGANGTNWYAQ